MKIIQQIKSAHKRYWMRKQLGTFLALEINFSVLMMDMILLCCGCHLLMTCVFMFVVLLYNYFWFRCELEKYEAEQKAKQKEDILVYEINYWKSAFRAQMQSEREQEVPRDILEHLLSAELRLDKEDLIFFSNGKSKGGGIINQIEQKQDESK